MFEKFDFIGFSAANDSEINPLVNSSAASAIDIKRLIDKRHATKTPLFKVFMLKL